MKSLGLVLICAACGRIGFGDAAPANLDYGGAHLLVYNDVAPQLTKFVKITPSLIGAADEFEITPNVETATGLTFDPVTGILSGNPDRASPATSYEITATSDRGSTSVIVVIRTAPGFRVNNEGDLGDSDLTDNDCIGIGTPNACSLRAAIEQLNAFDTTPRLIAIPDAGIALGGTELALATPLELVGAGRGKTNINAGGQSRVFDLGDNNTVTLEGMTLKNGVTAAQGGCVFAFGGDITLRSVALVGCTADQDGGAVMLSDNFGNEALAATIDNCIFDGNRSVTQGGGLSLGALLGGGVEITNTTFIRNTSTLDGGALFFGGGTIELDKNLFTENIGGGAMMFENDPTAAIRNTTITGNIGLTGTTGGILTNGGTLTLISNTIAQNTCRSCFLGAGVRQFTGGTMSMENTILVGNVDLDTSELANINSTATSLGHNLTDSPEESLPYVAATGDLFRSEPKLGLLEDNGGPTLTRAILDDSPAFNAGGGNCPPTDQRGTMRPARGGCDIGAFELE